jgi:hypothetical protein
MRTSADAEQGGEKDRRCAIAAKHNASHRRIVPWDNQRPSPIGEQMRAFSAKIVASGKSSLHGCITSID